jgi:hypothetical protein
MEKYVHRNHGCGDWVQKRRGRIGKKIGVEDGESEAVRKIYFVLVYETIDRAQG